MGSRSLEDYENKLRDGSIDAKTKVSLLAELREQLDALSQVNYAEFLARLMPVLLLILSGPPSFISTSFDQKLRYSTLETLQRLPQLSADPSVLEPFTSKVMSICLDLVRADNEENAVLSIKILMDLCRNYARTSAVAEKAQPFLDLILHIFDGMEQAVKDTFDSPSPPHQGSPPAPPSFAGEADQTTKQLAKGISSFKVVAECPIIVVMIFQAHRNLVPANIDKFLSRLKSTLMLQAAPQKRAHEEAKARGDIFTGIAGEIKTKGLSAAFGELITAQVKMMSFVAYLLRAHQNPLQEFLSALPDLTVRLLRDIPRTATATRKELLVAIRHVIIFNVRSIYLPVIPALLDPRTLVGDSLTAEITLRPLAYTMLADLIHHIRENLSADQISQVVSVYVGHLTGDDGIEVPGTSYQTMSAKLLLNMAECMSKLEDKKQARFNMMTVLDRIAAKFAAMNRAYPNAVKLSKQQAQAGHSLDAAPENFSAANEEKPDWDEIDIFSAMPINVVSPRDRLTDPVQDNRFLFKNLLHGLRPFFAALRNTNVRDLKDEVEAVNAPLNWSDLSYGFTAEEVEVLIRLFREGTQCFQYYLPIDQKQDLDGALNPSLASITANSKEEKDLLESFATIFHYLDPATVHEIFTSRLPSSDGTSQSGLEFLYEQSFGNPNLLHVPQFLLASEATSAAFCSMLLRFLMSKLPEVGDRDGTKTSVLLRLFKLSFMAVTLFSSHNEPVLLPHVRELITRSIELSAIAEEPINYFLLLRSLFRSIGGGRFEHLYREILPLLEMLLQVLNTHLAAAKNRSNRDLFVELSLTVPARLSNLLPHLSFLMRPLTIALRSGERVSASESRPLGANNETRSGSAGSTELTTQGLRTLELCIDNLTADYLDPIMQPWMEEIMGSLWRMLKPSIPVSTTVQPGSPPIIVTGYQSAHSAARILGKLGGRNRRFLTYPPNLEWRPWADEEPKVPIKLFNGVGNYGERNLPTRLGIDTSVERLWEPVPQSDIAKRNDEYYKRLAYQLITANVKMLIGSDTLPDDLAKTLRIRADDFAEKNVAEPIPVDPSDSRKSIVKRDDQQAILLKLLKALMFAAGTLDNLKADATRFLNGLYRHFMIIELGSVSAKERVKENPYDVKNREGPLSISTTVIIDAMTASLACEVDDVREVASNAMQSCLKMATVLCGTEDKAEKLPFFSILAERCIHACYEEEWFTQSGGVLGIAHLIDSNKMSLTDKWVVDRTLEFTRALLFVIKVMPQDLPANVRIKAKDTCVELVKRFASSDYVQKGDLKARLLAKDDKLHMIADRLVAELGNMNRHNREAARLSLNALASILGLPLHEIVNPVKDPLVKSIFNKPLRALPFATQIGYIDAITYMLDLGHDVLTFGDPVNRLLHETTALVDADDDVLAQKPTEYRTQESIIRLRVSGLKLLTTAMRLNAFNQPVPPNQQGQAGQQSQGQQPQQNITQHGARVTNIFFKSLYSKNKTVASVAHLGLKTVLDNIMKLPRDLLQNGLKPILMNVQDPRRLSVEGLEGLRTLLQLLTNYFKVEIGNRLLEHMRHVTDPTTLQRASFGLVDTDDKMNITREVFSIFHLLPSAAVQFLPDLVEKVLSLEKTLRRTRNSCFRAPLIPYFNRYAEESCKYFMAALKDEARGNLFTQLLFEEASTALRAAVVKNTNMFVDAFTAEGLTMDERITVQVNALQVAEAVCSFRSTGEELLANNGVRNALVQAATNVQPAKNRIVLPSGIRLAAAHASERILRICAVYLAQHRHDVDFLFGIVERCTKGELMPTPTLKAYLYDHVIASADVDYQQTMMKRSISTFTDKRKNQKMKWFVFHNILNPILANDVMRNWRAGSVEKVKATPLMNAEMIGVIHHELWVPQSVAAISDDGTHGVDHSRMELLQASSFLVKYYYSDLQDARKDLIKFGWNYIRRLDDHSNKYAAYCFIAFFIANYDTPPKIAVQVYNTLLRAHQAEVKNLVMQSLEILEPVLVKRLGVSENKQLVCHRLPRKVMADEIGNVQQLTSIYQFLVRHPDTFYEARDAFASIVPSTIGRVAQLPSLSAETRKLALNIISMIWQWENRAYNELGPLFTAQGRPSDRRWPVMGAQGRLTLIKYLVQFIATLPERFPVSTRNGLDGAQQRALQTSLEPIVKSLDLLKKLLSPPHWVDLDISSMFPKVTEQVLCNEHKAEDKAELWATRIINVLEILRVLVNSRSDEWVVARLPQLQKLLAIPLKIDNLDVQAALYGSGMPSYVPSSLQMPSLMKRILDAIPLRAADEELPDADDPSQEFLSFLGSTAGDALKNSNELAGINIVWAMAQRKPEDADTHVPALFQSLQNRLIKEHLAVFAAPANALSQSAVQPLSSPAIDASLASVLRVVDVLSARISVLNEQRRPYLGILATFVERSENFDLCEKIIKQVDNWIFDPPDLYPTLKEKTAVLQKMQSFEHRADSKLYNMFMDLVLRIYEDPKILRSELTVRLEAPFLIGLRNPNVEMRSRFMAIYDRALSRSMNSRLYKLICEQNWDTLANSFWLSQVIHLMFGSIDQSLPLRPPSDGFTCLPVSALYGRQPSSKGANVMLDSNLESLAAAEKQFLNEIGSIRARDVLCPLQDLQHVDVQLAHDIWTAFFPMCWSALAKDDRVDIEDGLVRSMTKEHHMRQSERRPNCISTMMDAIALCKPVCKMSPQVFTYLAKSYNGWYVAMTYEENLAMKPAVDTPAVRESNLDALVGLYSTLDETDLFYGLWRRRADYLETNAALSYEQIGVWDKAQRMYEQAQHKARKGLLPFPTGEYVLWEDQFIHCTGKLQNWEFLVEFAKHENNNDLYLESVWRNFEAWSDVKNLDHYDNIAKALSDAPTPKRLFFQAFISLLKSFHGKEQSVPFQQTMDDCTQLSIKNWLKLPRNLTNAHVGMLQHFQQLMELHDASNICQSLLGTNAGNLDSKSQDLKVLLSTWRDRLPNVWDDITAWQELITWRQHIFALINQTYLRLVTHPQNGGTPSNSYAYRGYHETAWIINRFAHVARKHQMPDLCISQLGKIYTLPNIEIQEAFLKLREQAKCHYQNPNEMTNGLEVINNTNLSFFTPGQKAEFYTLKGMFLSRLGQKTEAHDAFGSALYFDIKLPKAWAEWGRYSDNLFSQSSGDLELAGNAIVCYLEAAGHYKSAKSRKLLSRILWLLSLDDSNGTLAKAYNKYQGDQPWWYWITFIPQLFANLGRSPYEAAIAHQILAVLAKSFPQALHFHLRMNHEEAVIGAKRSTALREQREKAAREGLKRPDAETPQRPESAGGSSRPDTASGLAQSTETPAKSEEAKGNDAHKPKKALDYLDTLTVTLRTAFPLLYASMESMADQIQRFFKWNHDEDAFRIVVGLLTDAQQQVSRSPNLASPDSKMTPHAEAQLQRFADAIAASKHGEAFQADFIVTKLSMVEYITRLRRWRDRLADQLDRRPPSMLFTETTHLGGLTFSWFDELEVPGQYLQLKDKNQNFIRIERFLPKIDLVRTATSCYRRMTIRGHDGSLHPFTVQISASRYIRREERVAQLLRIFNSTLSKKKESRRRNLQFHIPAIIPLSASTRLVQDDESYVSLQAVYNDFCRRNDVDKDAAFDFTTNKLRQMSNPREDIDGRLEVFEYVQQEFVPTSVARSYFANTHPTFESFWLFRRQYSYQLAALTYASYTMHIANRMPCRIIFAQRNGNIWTSDMVPAMSTAQAVYHNPEVVPFRLTPNLQTVMGPLHTEGIFVCALMAIARCLTADSSYTSQPSSESSNGNTSSSVVQTTKCEMEQQLAIFIRDDIASWYSANQRQVPRETELKELEQKNAEKIVRRARVLGKEPVGNNLPASQSVLDLAADATSLEKIAKMDPAWLPWL
ncbi:hypothetical protein K470DRAFT_258588 [Piedraia hortae CBS 480.64]|uniref:Non-specific serine/threonine protein kinase n=1 Tax=Piedraia hortae CBS 480.64 TaxID=1314780 RepID=A0A6A7BYF5_9PEZI|nr:hypothetical protein K470DRAFT_258588 [Piedraia hortae CBS 480.64]